MKNKKWNLQSRTDFEELVMEFLNPLKMHYSEEGARLEIGNTGAVYEQDAAWTEAFLRPLWGLIPLWAGGSEAKEFREIYKKGLAAGTNPAGEEYWGGFHDVDQRFVEMASISYGILMTPEVLWDPLTKTEQDNLVKWLDGINHYECSPCNWMFFGVLVNIALKSKGLDYSQERIEEYLEYIESCYQGNGWYKDGQNGEKDYYVSFAFHYYSLIYARFLEDSDEERCKKYKHRASVFAEEFIYWFDEDGSALAYGRSLTYRLAQVSFFSMCVSCEFEVLPYPVMKGLIARHLRFWMEKPIFDNGGILTIGYGYSNLLMSEQYNAPGSPYWCMKVFALLSLPEQHPFWKTEEVPMPELSSTRLISNGSMLTQRIHGQVNAYVTGRKMPHQHVHMEEKYSKFLYSSRFAFSVPRSSWTLEEAAPDNMLAVVCKGVVYTKGITKNEVVNENCICMEWSPCEGVDITTKILLIPGGHRRTHTVKSSISCMAYDCGFAIPDKKNMIFYVRNESKSDEKNDAEVICQESGREWYRVRCRSGEGKAMVINASPNTNLMYPKTVIPGIVYEIEPGMQIIAAEFIQL